MIIDAMKRDVKVKCKKFKNQGRSVGIISRIDGTSLPISLKRSEMVKYIGRYGEKGKVVLNVEGEEINTEIVSVYRDLVLLFPHNIEFKEI